MKAIFHRFQYIQLGYRRKAHIQIDSLNFWNIDFSLLFGCYFLLLSKKCKDRLVRVISQWCYRKNTWLLSGKCYEYPTYSRFYAAFIGPFPLYFHVSFDVKSSAQCFTDSYVINSFWPYTWIFIYYICAIVCFGKWLRLCVLCVLCVWVCICVWVCAYIEMCANALYPVFYQIYVHRIMSMT